MSPTVHWTSDKLELTELPEDAPDEPVKRMRTPVGEAAFIEDGPPFHHLAFLTIQVGPGLSRGSHWHSRKLEHFYCIRGRVRIDCHDLDTGERFAVDFRTGMKLTMHPRLAHRFTALEPADLIEYYAGTYDPADTHPYTDWPA